MNRSVSWYVDKQITDGKWHPTSLTPAITGMPRPVTILTTKRKTSFIKHWRMSPEEHRTTFCPPIWSDLAIGSGACGLGCRACFLVLTHRAMRDPWRHLLYDNYDDMEREVRQWLVDRCRRSVETLGLGIDCSDSLLYEGFTGNARRFIPLFANPASNPRGCKLILLTKSANIHYLAGLPTEKVVVSFSLNPEPIADLWEGKYPDTFERITPPVRDRLAAAREVQDMGFEVRMRIDPVLTPSGWEGQYRVFWSEIRALGLRPRYITLGAYREKNPLLTTWASKWGLPAMEWQPDEMRREGSHYHLPDATRRKIYETIMSQIRNELPTSHVSVCKETHSMRRWLGLRGSVCNCLA